MWVEMTKPEIQSRPIRRSITLGENVNAFYNFYTIIKVECKQNSDIINES